MSIKMFIDLLTGNIAIVNVVGSSTPAVDGVYLVEDGDYFITEASDYLATE
jgi:hypothetical protein